MVFPWINNPGGAGNTNSLLEIVATSGFERSRNRTAAVPIEIIPKKIIMGNMYRLRSINPQFKNGFINYHGFISRVR
jgi:hypothetical protein